MTIERHARLREVQIWGDHFHFAVDAPEIGGGARPGQFVMVKVSEGTFPLLRRPLGIHGANTGGIELFFKVAGQGTELLSRKKPGDRLDILGPLGRGFTVTAAMKGKTAYLVGGGRGIAPLYFLALALVKAGSRPVVLYGGRCLADIPLRDRFERAGIEFLCSTDDGSFGRKGLVTHALTDLIEQRGKPAIVFAIGPAIMMKVVSALTKPLLIPTIVSLNTIMIDGTGMCGGCRVAVDGQSKFVCVDGPEFDGHKVDFDLMMKRQRTYLEQEAVARKRFLDHQCRLAGTAEVS